MLELVRLKDGSYKLTVRYQDESISVDSTWYFKACDPTDAEVAKRVFALNFGKDR